MFLIIEWNLLIIPAVGFIVVILHRFGCKWQCASSTLRRVAINFAAERESMFVVTFCIYGTVLGYDFTNMPQWYRIIHLWLRGFALQPAVGL